MQMISDNYDAVGIGMNPTCTTNLFASLIQTDSLTSELPDTVLTLFVNSIPLVDIGYQSNYMVCV